MGPSYNLGEQTQTFTYKLLLTPLTGTVYRWG